MPPAPSPALPAVVKTTSRPTVGVIGPQFVPEVRVLGVLGSPSMRLNGRRERHAHRGRCLLETSQADDYPEVVEIHKLSDDHCSTLKVRATSMHHLEGVIARLGSHGTMGRSVVLSTQSDGRPVEPPPAGLPGMTQSEGWRREPADVKQFDRRTEAAR